MPTPTRAVRPTKAAPSSPPQEYEWNQSPLKNQTVQREQCNDETSRRKGTANARNRVEEKRELEGWSPSLRGGPGEEGGAEPYVRPEYTVQPSAPDAQNHPRAVRITRVRRPHANREIWNNVIFERTKTIPLRYIHR